MWLLYFIGPILIATSFHFTRQKECSPLVVGIVWFIVSALSATIGAIVWQPTDENTLLASILGVASPGLFFGPFLIWARKMSIQALLLATIIIPVLSFFAMIVILLVSHQVWF